MDKKEAKKLGAWVSLLGGLCFVGAAVAAWLIMFHASPQQVTKSLVAIGHFLRPADDTRSH